MTVIISGSAGIQNPLGSAAAPSESNTTNSNTGAYFPTGTTYGIATNGSNAMYIDASQNVGIGTTSPQETLTVAKSSSAALGPIISSWNTAANTNNNAAAIGMRTSSDFSGAGIYGGLIKTILTNAAGHANEMSFSLYSDGAGGLTEYMRIGSSGNVGIGVTSPGSKLDVNGTIAARCPAGGTGLLMQGRSSDNLSQILGYDNGVTTLYGQLQFASTGGGVTTLISNGATGYTNFYTNGSERMRIDSSGNLLVGQNSTTTPPTSTSLTFVGNFYANPSSTAANAANAYWEPSTGKFWRSTSSLRYKTNVVDYTAGLADVMKLRSVTFNSANGSDPTKVFAGFIAEEVDALGLKEFVEYDAEGRPESLAYANMVSLLTKAIQELSAEVTALKAKVGA